MRPRWALGPALTLTLALLTGCGSGGEVGPQRVVVVSIDTLRADRLGAYGDASAGTPNLDALAARGARFDTALAPTPLTLPSHTTLLTGMDPPEHGVHHNGIFRLAGDIPTLSERFDDAGWATAAFVSAWILNARFGLDRGFDVYDDRMQLTQQQALAVAERRGDATVDAALAWLEDAPEPFFLWVHLYDPHAIYRAPKPWAGRYSHDPYAGEIAFADHQVGRLLDAIADRFGDGTLIALTADHGESLGEHGEATHAYTIYEATQRIPLILAGPGVPQGAVVPDVVQLSDLAPTLLELTGLAPLPEASGRSLAGVLRGQALEPRPAYGQSLAPHYDLRWSPIYSLRTETHRYLRTPSPELYDRTRDAAEAENVAAAQPALMAELSAALDARLAGAAPAAPNQEIDASDRARLAALGYLPDAEAGEHLVLGVARGPNPRDELGVVDLMQRANGLLEDDPAATLALIQDLGDEHWVLALRAAAGLAAGEIEIARKAAQGLTARVPMDAGGFVVLGQTWEAEGNLEEARRVYASGSAANPEDGEIITGLGRIAELEGRSEEASALYERAMSRPVPSADAVWRLAALRLEEGESEEARDLLLRLDPAILSREGPALRLGRAELRAGRIEMGLLRVQAGLRRHPDSAALLREKAALFEARGDLEASLAPRLRSLRLEPDSPVAQNDMAWALAVLRRKPRRALALAERAAATLPEEPVVLGTLAAAQLAAGDAEAALVTSDRALALASESDRTLLLLHRSEALASLGRQEAARRDYASALAGRNRSELSGGEAVVARQALARLDIANP